MACAKKLYFTLMTHLNVTCIRGLFKKCQVPTYYFVSRALVSNESSKMNCEQVEKQYESIKRSYCRRDARRTKPESPGIFT